MSVLHVYAILERAPRTAPRGLEGEALRFVRVGDVVAAIGELREAPAIAEPSLRGHDAVIRKLCEAADAVLPARFGQDVADHAAVRAALAPLAPSLVGALEQVRGAEQMTLRIHAGQSNDQRGLTPLVSPEVGTGARYLRTRAEALRVSEVDPLRAALRQIVRAERVEPGAAPAPWRASLFHLVPRGVSTEYLEIVGRVAPSLAPVRVEVSGPWPVYAFAGAIG